ncbi:unnamed protein product [Lampetra fluviatilis]
MAARGADASASSPRLDVHRGRSRSDTPSPGRSRARTGEDVPQMVPGRSESVASDSSTPTLKRKSKLSSLGKFLKPWTWRKKKPSPKFQQTSEVLERKISMRLSREELIRKGLLRDVPESELLNCDRSLKPLHLCLHRNCAAREEHGARDSAGSSARPPSSRSPLLPARPSSVDAPGASESGNPAVQPRPGPVPRPHSGLPPKPPVRTSFPAGGEGGPLPSDRPESQQPEPDAPHSAPQPPHMQHRVSSSGSSGSRYSGSGRSSSSKNSSSRNSSSSSSSRYSRSKNISSINSSSRNSSSRNSSSRNSSSSRYSSSKNNSSINSSSSRNSSRNSSSRNSSSRGTAVVAGTAAAETAGTAAAGTAAGTAGPPPGPRIPQPARQPASSSSSAPPLPPRPSEYPSDTQLIMWTYDHNHNDHDDDNNKENVDTSKASFPDEQQGLYQDDEDDEDGPILYRDDDDDDDDDGPVLYRDDEQEDNDDEVEMTGLLAKVRRNHSLVAARSLGHDPEVGDPQQGHMGEAWQELRQQIGTALTRRLSQRPTMEELEQRNILKQRNEEEEREEKREIKRQLSRKLSMRPTVKELRERKILRFNDYVELADVQDYDRRADKPWTRLTAADKAAIRKELNEFKSMEMEVHEMSRHMTR